MNESELFALLPEYALGVLDVDERQQVEALLSHSAQARAELRACQDMLAGMAALTPRQAAPARLTADFQATLAASGLRAARKAPGRVRWLLAATAAIVFVIAGIIGVNLASEADRRQQMRSIVSADNAFTVQLTAQNNAQGNVRFVAVPGEPRAVLVARLPELPQDKQYQLWMRYDNIRYSLLVFSKRAPEDWLLLSLPVRLPPNNPEFVVGITVEPTGGSPAPTTPAIFAWRSNPQ